MSVALSLLALAGLAGCRSAAGCGGSSPGARFDDVTAAAGLAGGYVGEDWGVAWGDSDGDGQPDLWLTHHASPPALYRNRGGGRFVEESAARLRGLDPQADQHGSAWADFDGDGDQDLVVLAGARQGTGSGPNQLWVFGPDGQATDQAQALGLDYPEGRGRVPIWVDADADGLLDLVLANDRRDDGLDPTALFLNGGAAGFVPAPASTGFAGGAAEIAQLAAVGDRLSIVLGGKPYPQTPLTLSEGALRANVSLAAALETAEVSDALYGDLGCDGLQDTVLLRGWPNGVPDVYQPGPDEVWAALMVGSQQLPPDSGFDLDGGRLLTIALEAIPPVESAEIFIGAAGRHPGSPQTFTLAADASEDQGIADYIPGEDAGLYLGYDLPSGRWLARLSGSEWRSVGAVVRADEAVTASPFQVSQVEHSARVMMSDAVPSEGLEPPASCAYGALADFDNDMDLDLFVSCATATHDEPNELWLNRGDGSFERAEDIGDAGGAASEGRSGAPVVADYDGDGALDLYLSYARADDTGFNHGPQALLHNRGNGNHWIALDLVGTGVNHQAIGARVELEAGGVTQVRYQLGGMHSRVQDHSRVHFGLADSERVEQLWVSWPDGTVQRLEDLDVDQIIQVIQP